MEQVFGTKEVPYAEKGVLTVPLPEAVADAFDMVMNYIYTDRIHCKFIKHLFPSGQLNYQLTNCSKGIHCLGRQAGGAGYDGHLPTVGAV